jgi:hypothetical protein
MLGCGKTFSQIDIQNKVVLDTLIAKKIAIELIQGDECKEEVNIIKNNVYLLEKKVTIKDSIILSHKKQISNLDEIVDGTNKLLSISKENLANTKKQLTIQKRNTILYKGTTLLFIGVSGYLLLK